MSKSTLHQHCPVGNDPHELDDSKILIEMEGTPRSVASAGTTTRTLWLKIKAAIKGVTDSITDGVATIKTAIDSAKSTITSSIASAKSAILEALPTDYAKSSELPTDYAKATDIPTNLADADLHREFLNAMAYDFRKMVASQRSLTPGGPSTLLTFDFIGFNIGSVGVFDESKHLCCLWKNGDKVYRTKVMDTIFSTATSVDIYNENARTSPSLLSVSSFDFALKNNPTDYAKTTDIPTDYAKATDIPTDYAKASELPTNYAKEGDVIKNLDELAEAISTPEGIALEEHVTYIKSSSKALKVDSLHSVETYTVPPSLTQKYRLISGTSGLQVCPKILLNKGDSFKIPSTHVLYTYDPKSDECTKIDGITYNADSASAYVLVTGTFPVTCTIKEQITAIELLQNVDSKMSDIYDGISKQDMLDELEG